jgi:hypothetical protein
MAWAAAVAQRTLALTVIGMAIAGLLGFLVLPLLILIEQNTRRLRAAETMAMYGQPRQLQYAGRTERSTATSRSSMRHEPGVSLSSVGKQLRTREDLAAGPNAEFRTPTERIFTTVNRDPPPAQRSDPALAVALYPRGEGTRNDPGDTTRGASKLTSLNRQNRKETGGCFASKGSSLGVAPCPEHTRIRAPC